MSRSVAAHGADAGIGPARNLHVYLSHLALMSLPRSKSSTSVLSKDRKECEYCGKTFQPRGFGVHVKVCAQKHAASTVPAAVPTATAAFPRAKSGSNGEISPNYEVI